MHGNKNNHYETFMEFPVVFPIPSLLHRDEQHQFLPRWQTTPRQAGPVVESEVLCNFHKG